MPTAKQRRRARKKHNRALGIQKERGLSTVAQMRPAGRFRRFISGKI